MSNYKIPGYLYKTLPYVYISTGVLVIYMVGNAYAIFSGVMLLSAGIAVIYMRRQNKKGTNSSRGNNAYKTKSGYSGSLRLDWGKKYESGNKGIDDQHRKLFDICNQIIDDMYSKRDVRMKLESLLTEVRAHFSAEETLLDTWSHPLAQEHKQIHNQLLVEAQGMLTSLDRNLVTYQEVFGFFAYTLVLKHLVDEDQKFFGEI